MKGCILIISSMMLLGGCLVHTGNHRHNQQSSARSRDCPPAYHWNGGACVHNGKAKGHYKK